MTTLAELIARDDVRAAWFYTHSENVSDSDNRKNPDMYDAVFSINDGISQYGGRMNRRHAFFRGIGQSPALSRPNQGDRLVKPDPVETLGHLLSDAAEIDANPTFREWAEYRELGAGQPAWDQLAHYETQTAMRDRMRAWLGEHYDEYQAADRD